MAVSKTPPSWLKGAGRKYWASHVDRLIADGTIVGENRILFEMLCAHVTESRKLQDDIAKNGTTQTNPSGCVVQNPCVSMLVQTQKRIESLGRQLGLWGTMAARRRKFEGLRVVGSDNLGDGARKRGG